MPNIVPPIGPKDAKIVLIGEAPGEEEVIRGEPFVGSSGRLLKIMLDGAGIDWRHCYLTNVVKQRPPQNDFSTFYLDPKTRREPSELLKESIKSLQEELKEIKSHGGANVIVPLGTEPLRAITGRTSIEKWRGSVQSSPFGKCIGTYHPSYVLRLYSSRTTVELDLRRIARESLTPSVNLTIFSFELDPSFERVMEFLHERPEKIAFDIETTHHFVRCLGIADSPTHALCIPFMSQRYQPMVGGIVHLSSPVQQNSHWSAEQEYRILDALDKYMGSEDIKKIAQNFPFDGLVIADNFGIDCSRAFSVDTMVAQHTMYSELPKGLDYLASVYTDIPYYSDFDAGSDRQTWEYNCYDCVATYQVATAMEKEIPDVYGEEHKNFYSEVVHPTIVSFARADTVGVLVDKQTRDVLTVDTKRRLEELGDGIKRYSSGLIINPNSDTQIRKYLYESLGLPAVLSHKTGQPTVDVHARKTLSSRHSEHRGFFEALDEYSKKATLLSGFLEKELAHDGRIRTHYNVTGTVTGRLSSSEPLFNVGTNLQNIPRGEFRRLFIADPGFLFIKADLSQAEFRIVVWKAAIRRIIEKYVSDPTYDIHRYIASLIFSKPPESITKAERSIAKNGVYGGQYGMHDVTAARTYGLDLQTARFVLSRFHSLFPEIRENFWTSIQREVSTTRTITGPLGRKRLFLDRLNDDLYRTAYSHYAQHLVGDIINRAFLLSDHLWDKDVAFPVLQVHDEIVALAREGEVQKYARSLKKFMEYAVRIPETPEPLVIPAEVSIGRNWYDTKPLELFEKEGMGCLTQN